VNGRGHAHTLSGTVQRFLPQDADDPAPQPLALHLGRCTPNPFHTGTEISYALPAAERITIEVYSVTGRSVRTLLDERVEPGNHRAAWDGTDGNGKAVPAGVYYVRLSTSTDRIVRSVTLIR